MQITKSRLKEIVKEELSRVNEDNQEVEQEQVSKLQQAYDLAVQLEQFVGKNQLAKRMVGDLYGLLAELLESESEEI